MIESYETHDPDDQQPYWFDGRDRATDEGSPIVDYDIAIDVAPDGALTIANDSLNDGVVSWYPIGGTLDETYVIRCRFILENGDHFDHSRSLTIEQH